MQTESPRHPHKARDIPPDVVREVQEFGKSGDVLRRIDFTPAAIFAVAARVSALDCAPIEVRVSYDDDVMRTELFRGVDRDERLAETADSWRLALLERGFSEIPLQHAFTNRDDAAISHNRRSRDDMLSQGGGR